MKETIKLIRKPDPRFDITQLVVVDDLISGLLSGSFYAPVVTGQDKGLRIMPLEQLIENYQFPALDGKSCCRITDFLQGYPKLYKQISFYEINTVTA